MADITEDQPEVAVPLNPALAAFQQSVPEGASDIAADQSSKIQGYLEARALAADAHAQGDAVVQNAQTTQQNLVDMVKADPHSTGLALDLAGSSAELLSAHHPDDDERNLITGALTRQYRGSIAHAAVQTWANVDADAARGALDRYGEHLPAGEHAALTTYIDAMDTLRGADANAAKLQGTRDMVAQSDGTMLNHFSALAHPETGALQFPKDWGVRMMTDESMAPQAKASLYTAFTNLQQNGDPHASDPQVLSDMLSRTELPYNHPDHPSPMSVVQEVGRGLTMADASFLASRVGPQSPARRDEITQLNDALETAHSQLGSETAYGRFTNWFLPAYQRATALGLSPSEILNPASKGYALTPERMAQFAPTGDDLVAPAQASVAGEVRASLGDIFSKGRGFAMRTESEAENGALTPKYREDLGEQPSAMAKIGRGFAGLPGAVAHAAGQAWRQPSHEQMSQEAYDAADANPITDSSNATPVKPRETMVNMPGAE